MEIASFQTFLAERIKVAGKAGTLGDVVSVSNDKTKVTVTWGGHVQLPQVPHQEVPEEAQRARLAPRHCVQQGPRVCELRYFNIAEQEDDE